MHGADIQFKTQNVDRKNSTMFFFFVFQQWCTASACIEYCEWNDDSERK